MAEAALPEIHLPWHNPHERPSDAVLVAHYAEPLPALVAQAREGIVASLVRDEGGRSNDKPGIVESLAWHGMPWRWSWAYRFAEADEHDRGLVYLVPAAAAPEVCVPLSYDMYEAMPKTVATTFIRQGITVAREIGDYRWVEWAITQQSQLDEVLAVVRHKVAYLRTEKK